jgi:DNA-binding NtrC family response regulator
MPQLQPESQFVGRAPAIVALRDQIAKLGWRRPTVLIDGETGTGKEVAARSLYNVAPRGQFVAIDCASLVSTMMESELFGHVRGAFTGAMGATKGLIEMANGGMAFFDEIGELPIEMQARLLRPIQEREVRPVGSLESVKVDVWVVAATNRNLEREVAAGRFRADLFHRLNVVRLTLPPLREHKEDIPLLIEGFLAAADDPCAVSNDAMKKIMEYDWPGNVRELKNCLERMLVFRSGPLLEFGELPTEILNHVCALNVGPAGSGAAEEPHGRIAGSIEGVVPLCDLERQAIHHALQQTQGDQTAAAQLLGIGRTTLYRKLIALRTGVRSIRRHSWRGYSDSPSLADLRERPMPLR